MRATQRQRTNGLLGMTFMLTALCWGCGVTAEIEMIQGQVGRADADIQVFEVQSSTNGDCKRGVSYLAMQRWSDAAAAFRLALDADPDDHHALFGLGVAREQDGDPCDAAASYEAAVLLTQERKQSYLDAERRARDKCDPRARTVSGLSTRLTRSSAGSEQ